MATVWAFCNWVGYLAAGRISRGHFAGRRSCRFGFHRLVSCYSLFFWPSLLLAVSPYFLRTRTSLSPICRRNVGKVSSAVFFAANFQVDHLERFHCYFLVSTSTGFPFTTKCVTPARIYLLCCVEKKKRWVAYFRTYDNTRTATVAAHCVDPGCAHFDSAKCGARVMAIRRLIETISGENATARIDGGGKKRGRPRKECNERKKQKPST